jgi:hypothetical protein
MQSLLASAQLFDTTVYQKDLSTFITSFGTEDLNLDHQDEDTALPFAHRLLRNEITDPIRIHTGRIAGPGMWLEPAMPNTDEFQSGRPLFANVFHHVDSIKYYNSTTPRTKLSYSQGTANLLYLGAQHSQNIAKNWSFGIDYTRVKSHNLYHNNLPAFNQERMANVFATSVYSHFTSRNRKYEIFGAFVNNRNNQRETHGITNAPLFDLFTGRDKSYSGEAWLSDAQNLFITRDFSIHQFYRMGKREIQVNDSTIVPDTATDNIKFQWFHQLNYRRNINRFSDNTTPNILYPDTLFSAVTLDSIFNDVIQNRFGFKGKIKGFNAKGWILHEVIRVKQLNAHQSRLQHVQLGGKIVTDLSIATLDAGAKYSVTGYYAGDFALEGSLTNSSKLGVLNVALSQIRHRPDYNDQFFGSNYYYWNNGFEKTDISRGQVSYALPKGQLRLHVDARLITGQVYYDTTGIALQHNSTIRYSKASLINELKLGRSYYLNNRIVAQTSSNRVLPLPQLLYKASLYKEGFLFKKNMWTRFGVDVSYFSEFQGYGYNPVVRQFTLARGNIGGYPIIDVFLNAQVQTMTLFASLQHAGQGFFINDAFSAENYPLIGRAVRFGVQWRLFD